ncbi:MAG: sigma-54 dependent transcriptional regulator [Bryobacteraceae bacterium]
MQYAAERGDGADGRRKDVILCLGMTEFGLRGEHPACRDPWEAVGLARSGGYTAVAIGLPLAAGDLTPEELLETFQRTNPALPCVFVSAAPSLEEGLRLARLGAYDYIPASEDLGAVFETLERTSGRAEPPENEPWRALLVGDSLPMKAVIDTVRLIAPRRSTVLISGETGTGKEMAARAIHAASTRSHHPLVAVNCSALPDNLLEAELFGHVKGAFTGAVANRTGRFEQAHQGTLFLDEIAEMPLDLQSKLLRVLQEREIQRLGSSETIRVDVRVLAACNVDLEQRVAEGRFREDLYYRLNVVPLAMPPLRARAGDVAVLARHFSRKICKLEGIAAKRLAQETLDRLAAFAWPGNVRQLENAVEMAIALSGTRETLVPADFPLPSPRLGTRSLAVLAAATSAPVVPESGLDFELVVNRLERDLLQQALHRTNGNKSAAAELLRLKRTTLNAKLKALAITETGMAAAAH